MPGAQLILVALAVAGNQLGVDLIGLDPLQLTPRVIGNLRGVHHANPVAQSVQVLGQSLVVGARRLHHDPGPRLAVLVQPFLQHLKAHPVVGQLGLGAVLTVGLPGGDIETVLGNVNADDAGHATSSIHSAIITAPGPAL
ncbi:hypothetical protein D9M70_530240 [compost metagenome]